MTLSEDANRLTRWLKEAALPLWRDRGFDAQTGFYELLGLDGAPVAAPVRARVNPRQVYCFAEAGRRGWVDGWREPVEGGIHRFDACYLKQDGTYGSLAAVSGERLNERFDLYDQAFALLGFAALAEALPERRSEMTGRARALLSVLRARFGHAESGFEEGEPPIEPLRANPHMHLLEAALAWEAVDDVGAPWGALADEIAGLCLHRLRDPETGAIGEYFDRHWNFVPGPEGARVEPGHQFEWAWLLTRWSVRRNKRDVIAHAERLFDVGEDCGVDAVRNVAVMALGRDLATTDPLARLWAQTERLKAALVLAAEGEPRRRERYVQAAVAACSSIEAFLDVPLAGLWRDKQQASGRFIDEPAPASTFYHLVCAVAELSDRLPEITARASAE